MQTWVNALARLLLGRCPAAQPRQLLLQRLQLSVSLQHQLGLRQQLPPSYQQGWRVLRCERAAAGRGGGGRWLVHMEQCEGAEA